MRLLLINGPNLNLLGKREPSIYGSMTLESIETDLKKKAQLEGIQLECFQSNFEGALVERIQKAIGNVDAILINAGAYLFPKLLFPRKPAGCCFSLETDVLPALINKALYGLYTSGPFIDIGTPQSFEKINRNNWLQELL